MTATVGTYKVGYSRPSKEHSWKKGQSGNPAGRKKDNRDIKVVFLRAAVKVGKFVVFDRARRMTLWDMFNLSVAQRAHTGDPFFIDMMAKLQEAFPVSDVPPGYKVYRDEGGARIVYPITRERHLEIEQNFKQMSELLTHVNTLLRK